MTVKTITHASGKSFRLGRTKPPGGVALPPRHMRLGTYLMGSQLEPPRVCHYSTKAETALSKIYKNDVLGCCEIAGPAHCIGVFSGNAGNPLVTFTDDQITAIYSAVGGYVPGNPDTDRGCDTQAMLTYWRDTGFDGHKIEGWLSVAPKDAKTALWLFENLIFGVDMPDAWVNPMPEATGFTWDVDGDPDEGNGHCFVGVGYNDNGVQIGSWGMVGTIKPAAIAKYTALSAQGELYTVISQETLDRATAKAPSGFDWSQLVANFNAMGGQLELSA